MILLIDNYDSFTYNLVQYLGELGAGCQVYRNDQIDLPFILRTGPDYLVVSPGPCTPQEAGISKEAILMMAGRIPILGVCLGHQCIGAVFGGKIIQAKRLMHGKSSLIHHDGKTIYRGLPNPFKAIRYHSLIVERESLPECLEISAETEEGEIMGLRHKVFPIEGVQFHPESIMTEGGKILLENFLQRGENSHVERNHR
ncbi:MAG: aminodeoxychorismate/anthranilate synthase component II [Thermodesulfobacteriota bacterium]|nr:aminodeoxychorismate/anthranilate synthase component II [Thermodesulfobacteriota bacterium]